DDIDALLDSMNVEAESEVAPEPEAEPEVDEPVEITDPDDIDALLDAMNIEAEPEAATEVEPEVEESAEITDNLEPTIEEILAQNKVKIENLTEDYVAPFLAADFSELRRNENDNIEFSESVDESENTNDVIDDDLDIDSLIAEVNDSAEKSAPIAESASEDDFDDLLGDMGDDITEDINSDFDESILTDLLNEEEPTEAVVELSPDFSDQNVLADLLADKEDSGDSEKITVANEIEDIQELDNLDFDELLANIEEESSVSQGSESSGFNQNEVDYAIDISNNLDESLVQASSFGITDKEPNEDDFISVDSLLSESLDTVDTKEPYKKEHIDVGLNEYPEFTEGANLIDVDDDDNGMAAKLDLAKVYFEIGDKENAEVILLDVVVKGDAQQQYEAQQLLDDL
ncbi:MAG: hypothetical protein OCD00_12495, partial [Colwellia sp.]